jgi:hypothetical protein
LNIEGKGLWEMSFGFPQVACNIDLRVVGMTHSFREPVLTPDPAGA